MMSQGHQDKRAKVNMKGRKVASKCMTATLLLAFASLSFSLDRAATRFEFVQPHMGTTFRIICYAPDREIAQRASTIAFDRVASLDNIMSDYHAESELMLLCSKAGGPPVRISEELFCVLQQSQELARQTDGAFDVTIGPVSRLWRRARRRQEMPDPSRLSQALDLVSYQNLRLDPKQGTAQLLKEGMVLDLGGIAKGYAADEALRILKERGIKSALVAAGGDIAVSAPPPGSKGWTIGIGPLEPRDESPKRSLILHDAAVSTSGDAEQFVEIGGQRYSHIVNPKTGIGLKGRMSVTVVAPLGILSDSLATAVSVLGPERGLKLAESYRGTSAFFVEATEGKMRLFQSKGWNEN